MQQKITLLVICILLISASANRFKSENQEITKYFVLVPATDASHKSFYISSIEITNKQYRDFLKDLSAKGETEKLERAKVDSSQWDRYERYCGPFLTYYFKHPAYDNYPVVNISKDGAKLYCQWLTEKYNDTARVKVQFALPTEEQWIQAAKGGDSTAIYPWQGDSLKYQKRGKWYKYDLCDYKHQSPFTGAPKGKSGEGMDITAPSISYLPNAYGIYNMAGNVAELLADKDYTKGGSWNSHADKVTIAAKEEFTGSVPTVGFRPVMIITGAN